MDKMEKVERLREKANVSYEEAKEALEAAGDDLLDAMVLLERQGKVKMPKQPTYSTEYEQQENYIRVKDKVEEQEKGAPRLGRSFVRLIKAIFAFARRTFFTVTRNEETIFTVPTIVFVLILFFFWEIAVPVLIIALFFNVRYSFEGGKDAEKANEILGKAGDFAQEVRDELSKPEAGPEDENR